ncbi:MAG TPA: hypothetical protein VGC79_26425 [Polyangiaceae bacterium]
MAAEKKAQLGGAAHRELVEIRVELDALLAVLYLRISRIVEEVAGVEKDRFPQMEGKPRLSKNAFSVSWVVSTG